MTNGIGGFGFNQNHALRLKQNKSNEQPEEDSVRDQSETTFKGPKWEEEQNRLNQPKKNLEVQPRQGRTFLG